jgi:flagellar basal body-associated protein FliL
MVWACGTAVCHPCHARRQKTHSRMLVVMLLVVLPLFAAAAGFIGWVFLSIPRR